MPDSQMPAEPVTRERLYEEVWTTPIHTLAKRYGFSDRGLAKLCAREAIPVPPRGYWAKIRAGLKLRRPCLPPAPERRAHRHGRGLEALKPVPEGVDAPDVQPFFAPEIAALIDRLHDAPALEIRDDLRGRHPAVRAAARGERELRARQREWGHRRPWTNARAKPGLSTQLERRALLLLDALARDAAAHGADLWLGDHRGACVAGTLLGGRFRVWVHEPLRRIKHAPKPGERASNARTYEHSGRLEMGFDLGQYTVGRRWIDGREPLEERLREVLPAVLRAIDADLRSRSEWERRDREKRDLERARAEAEAARRADAERRASLLREGARWRRVAVAREYVAAVERTILDRVGSLDPTTPAGEWIAWARGVLDAADPLRWRAAASPTVPPSANAVS